MSLGFRIMSILDMLLAVTHIRMGNAVWAVALVLFSLYFWMLAERHDNEEN